MGTICSWSRASLFDRIGFTWAPSLTTGWPLYGSLGAVALRRFRTGSWRMEASPVGIRFGRRRRGTVGRVSARDHLQINVVETELFCRRDCLVPRNGICAGSRSAV